LYSIPYKAKAPIQLGAFNLYSIEYKPKAPIHPGSLYFVLNSIQSQGPHPAPEPLICIQLNTKPRVPSSLAAFMLYSIEYKAKAPFQPGAFYLHSIEYKTKGPIQPGGLYFVFN